MFAENDNFPCIEVGKFLVEYIDIAFSYEYEVEQFYQYMYFYNKQVYWAECTCMLLEIKTERSNERLIGQKFENFHTT